MKKIFTLFVFVFVVSGVAQAQNITRGSFDDSLGQKTYFYIYSDGVNFFWGCDDSIVPWVKNTKLYYIETENGSGLNMLKIANKNQQNNLSTALSVYILSRELKPKDAFRKIFSYYQVYESIYPDWTIMLLIEANSK